MTDTKIQKYNKEGLLIAESIEDLTYFIEEKKQYTVEKEPAKKKTPTNLYKKADMEKKKREIEDKYA